MTIEASLAAPADKGDEAKDDPSPAKTGHKTRINDVVITIATSNGTGSQSANLVLMRTIFQMGVPVGGKNMFPSNIQGLPTWFTIRANKDNWTCRRAGSDVFVAMNAESILDDLKDIPAGSILILNEDLKPFLNRTDLITYIVPFSKLVVSVCPDGRLRRLVVNMMYVGVVAWLLQLEMDEVRNAINRQFASKPKAAELNAQAAVAGYQWAAENLQKQDLYRIERMDKTRGKIIIEGNVAAGIGFMYGGAQVVAWYPITPSSSVAETIMNLMPKYRHDPETGKATYAIVQAEDELAAIAMVVGAGWAGARALTATSGPGISLMAEIAGLSYFTEIPAVICDVQRMGPSTGLPTRTSQGDIMKAYYLSHGDCKHPMLIPGNVQEVYEFAMEVLNLAEQLQTLVFLMLDLDLGMNSFMTEPLQPPTKPINRGKVLNAEQLEQVKEFARYRDVDGDGIPYRTVPGTPHPRAAFFTRGTGHTDRATYSEKPDDWQGNLDRLTRKFDTARKLVPQPVFELQEGATLGIVAYGTTDAPVQEARAIFNDELGTKLDYMRIRALPPNDEVRDFIEKRDYVYIIEQNRDAQMACILRNEWPHLAPRIRSVLHYNGLPLDARTIVNEIQEQEQKS